MIPSKLRASKSEELERSRGVVRGTAGRRGMKGRAGMAPEPAMVTHYATFLVFVKWYVVSGLSSDR